MSGTILDEAERIKQELLAHQASIAEAVSAMESQLLEGARQRLGSTALEAVDQEELVDTRIVEKTPVVTPAAVTTVVPLSQKSAQTTADARKHIRQIILGHEDRLLVIVGPCSIHDPEAALEYADWLKIQRETYHDTLEVVMRAYMEKPRTELGWKGFVYDPRLDDSCDINLGLIAARIVACQITEKGVPIAMERLNASTPQYFNGLVAYDAIGARNTTDQKAREYASGTSSPVGFKNTPEGSIKAAVEAVKAANAPHTFLGMNANGLLTQIATTGNESAHLILRGSENGPNYTADYVQTTRESLEAKRLPQAIVIDASHGNSGKNPEKHAEVIAHVAGQIRCGEWSIKGVMIESNLVKGKQSLEVGQPLTYGQSITDGCSGLEETHEMLQTLAEAVETRQKKHFSW
jgi:3-deoxy-7-phosphoheptulonate synthase